MNFPVLLNYGLVSIYHIRQVGSVHNITGDGGTLNFGSIYSISPYGINYVNVGVPVSFKGDEAKCRLLFHKTEYAIIEEAKLVTIGDF
jgi:hypothetical protein